MNFEVTAAILRGTTANPERDVRLMLLNDRNGCYIGKGTPEINAIINAASSFRDFVFIFAKNVGNRDATAVRNARDLAFRRFPHTLLAELRNWFFVEDVEVATRVPLPAHGLFGYPGGDWIERVRQRIRVLSLYTRDTTSAVWKFLDHDGDNALMTRVLEFLLPQ